MEEGATPDVYMGAAKDTTNLVQTAHPRKVYVHTLAKMSSIMATRLWLIRYYYYSRPVSVSQKHAHIRVVVFHTLHRGLRNTILCPYFFMFTMLAHF